MSEFAATVLKRLVQCVDLEEKEQAKRYRLDQQHTLRALKSEGLALHPLIVTRRSFGYADYPEVSFRLSFPPDTNQFRDGAAIECFYAGEEPVKGILLSLEGKQGEFRLFAPDFPDWIEEDGVGIKLAPDTRTTQIMKTSLKRTETDKRLHHLFEEIHDERVNPPVAPVFKEGKENYFNKGLNDSQRDAVSAILQNEHVCIVHGPPGTGKTTTLVEAIRQLVKSGAKVAVSAPSNTAVDNLARYLIQGGVNVLRVGNTSKVDEAIFKHTIEGKLGNAKQQKEIKQLKIRAEEFRKMALKYKRSFGKAEREQRALLFKEVRKIRDEIKQLQTYNEEKLFTEAQVIAGTPVGLYDAKLEKHNFHTVIIDEAGQCIEPLAWCVFPLSSRIVLAGDHLQLPPTVLSDEAARLGFNRSILEMAVRNIRPVFLLNTQYRMRAAIAGFSSDYFYNGLLKTPGQLANAGVHITFIDTAGSGNEEKPGAQGVSLQNEGELSLIIKLMELEQIDPGHAAFISPYAGQVEAARQVLPKGMRTSTIDSFQGQEEDVIMLSLVRSNDDGTIGFLKDYRRMNVAMTRAREHLYVVGDSATIGADNFYRSFLEYAEKNGAYRTVWEFDM